MLVFRAGTFRLKIIRLFSERARRVGYVNELLSRLTGNITYAEMDRTQVNHTLDR